MIWLVLSGPNHRTNKLVSYLVNISLVIFYLWNNIIVRQYYLDLYKLQVLSLGLKLNTKIVLHTTHHTHQSNPFIREEDNSKF